MKKDVDMTAVEIVLAMAERRGVPRARLLRGSPLADRVGARDVPVTWDAYVQIVDRLKDAVGGHDAMADVGAELAAVTPHVSEFAAVFVSPLRLARFLARVLDPRIWPCVRITFDELGGNVARAVHEVPEHYREAASVFAAGIGAWRTLPTRLGLPPAEMLDVDVGPRRGAYVMRFPEPVPVPARVRRRALEAFARFAVEELEVESAAAGHAFVVAGAGERDAHARAMARWGVTPREREILALLVHGYANKDIANHLGCAPKTVEMHVSNLMRKCGVRARAELVSSFWQMQ
jgi:DNA-binding CsgD family transcriptional regulator